MSQADTAFWRIRRLLGVHDLDDCPSVDQAIRQELEQRSLEHRAVSIKRIRQMLQLSDDGKFL